VLRWNHEAHVNMVEHNVAFDDLTLFLSGQSLEDGPEGGANLAVERFSPSFGNKDHMIFAIPLGVG